MNENPFNKLITYGDAVSPTLTAGGTIEYWDTPYRSRVRGRTTLYGSLEFRINLQNDLNAGEVLFINMPVNCDRIRCS